MWVYYRISDKGNNKNKLAYASKQTCLLNAVHEFGRKNFHIIADNCSEETLRFIHKNKLSYEETSLGNAASFLFMLNKIKQERAPEDAVYLLEDDYLHRPGSKKVLLEGLNIAEYVTLYDHPDKYYAPPTGNPFNFRRLQKTRIYITPNAHWRETNSTTMTVACRVKTLRRDYFIWKLFCSMGKMPKDFLAFVTITQRNFFELLFLILQNKKAIIALLLIFLIPRKPKKLISAIPAYSTHVEKQYLSPFIDWKKTTL